MAQIQNGGFETAGLTISNAANWTVDTAAGGPVYGARTNDNPFAGSFDFQVHLASVGAGPVVQFNQSAIPVSPGPLTLSFEADRLSGSAGDVEEYNIQWFNASNGLISQTGYTGFSPGANVYALTSANVTAPAGAVTATVFLHFAGAAAPTLSANVDIDNVALVPEPTTMSLIAMGLLGGFAMLRRRKK